MFSYSFLTFFWYFISFIRKEFKIKTKYLLFTIILHRNMKDLSWRCNIHKAHTFFRRTYHIFMQKWSKLNTDYSYKLKLTLHNGKIFFRWNFYLVVTMNLISNDQDRKKFYWQIWFLFHYFITRYNSDVWICNYSE